MSDDVRDAVERALTAAGVAADALFVDVPVVSRLLGVSEWSAYGAIKRGEIPAVRVGRRLVVGRGTLVRLAGGILSAAPTSSRSQGQPED